MENYSEKMGKYSKKVEIENKVRKDISWKKWSEKVESKSKVRNGEAEWESWEKKSKKVERENRLRKIKKSRVRMLKK